MPLIFSYKSEKSLCGTGGGNATKINPNNKPLTSDFVSLHLKGRSDGFALKGGDATQGQFQTM